MSSEHQDEKTELREDFDKEAEEIELDINEAMNGSTCGWGTLLYTTGTFFFCALEGAEIVLLTIIGPILRCEWNLSSAALSGLQISTMITMLITPLVTSTFGDRFGRKRISLIAAVSCRSHSSGDFVRLRAELLAVYSPSLDNRSVCWSGHRANCCSEWRGYTY